MQLGRRLITATSLWASAVCTMAASLISSVDRLGDVSILFAVTACVPTFSIVGEHLIDRATSRTVRGVCEAIGTAQGEGKLRHLH